MIELRRKIFSSTHFADLLFISIFQKWIYLDTLRSGYSMFRNKWLTPHLHKMHPSIKMKGVVGERFVRVADFKSIRKWFVLSRECGTMLSLKINLIMASRPGHFFTQLGNNNSYLKNFHMESIKMIHSTQHTLPRVGSSNNKVWTDPIL